MRKAKNALLVLLAVLLVAAGGLLPMAAAQLQDKTTAGTVQYEDIEALQLKLKEEAVDMTFFEKLFLLSTGTGIQITSEKTRLSEDEILDTAYTALIPYMELVFGKGMDNDALDYYPVMAYDENDPSRFTYYWWVYLSWDSSEGDYTAVVLDDETGKLLAIEMYDPDFNIDAAYLQELQYAVAATYFEELGLDPAAAWPQAVESAKQTEDVGITTLYQFVDVRYGEVNVEVCFRTDGFYINIG